MKTTNKNLCLSLILCLVLIAAMALLTVGCTDNNSQETPATSADTKATTEVVSNAEDATSAETTPGVTVKGEGDTVFYFNVIDKDGGVTKFEIHTNETKVGKALQNVQLIEGEEGAYGLYVKTVNGITADYDTDGTWWEFMVGEQSSMTGVDLTDIEAGATYAFRVSK